MTVDLKEGRYERETVDLESFLSKAGNAPSLILKFKKLSLRVYDCQGTCKIPALWRHSNNLVS